MPETVLSDIFTNISCAARHKCCWKIYKLFFLNFFTTTSITVSHLALGLNSIRTVHTLLWRRNKQKLADTTPKFVQILLDIFLPFKSVKILFKIFKSINEKYYFKKLKKKRFYWHLKSYFSCLVWKKSLTIFGKNKEICTIV